MGHSTPMELTKIKKIVAEIQEFPAKIDSTEQAKNARRVLKKYALLSEKIERNVLISTVHQKDLAKIRTEEFKAIRRSLKEKANLILHAKDNKNVPSEKAAKKTVKTVTPKKAADVKTSKAADVKDSKDSKAVDEKASKVTAAKKTVKKSPPKTQKETASKKGE